MRFVTATKTFFLAYIVLNLIAGCKNATTNNQFPPQEKLYAQPNTKPFITAEPKKIIWEYPRTDTNKAITTKKIDWSHVVAKPFDLGNFQQANGGINKKSIDWNQLPTAGINIDTIPVLPMQFKTSVLPEPRIVKAGLPHPKDNSMRPIFEMGQDQGIPDQKVYCMFRDKLGMIWVASENSISRFDGENWEIYSIVGKKNNGSPNAVSQLIEDDLGQIWIGTIGDGIYILNQKARLLKHVVLSTANTCFSLCKDHTGRIWYSNTKFICIADPVHQTVQSLLINKLNKGIIAGLTKDQGDKFWISKDRNGLTFFDPTAHIMIDLDSAVIGDLLNDAYIDSKNRVWAQGRKDFYLVDPSSQTISRLDRHTLLKCNAIWNFLEDSKGKFWIGTDSGVRIIDPSNLSMVKYINNITGILGDNIGDGMIEDGQGQVWIGTDHGINIISKEDNDILNFDSHSGLSASNIWGIVPDSKGQLWMGSQKGGLNIIDQVHSTIKILGLQQGFFEGTYGRIQLKGDSAYICASIGLYIINLKNDSFCLVGPQQGVTKTNGILDLFLDAPSGKIWMGASRVGLEGYDPANGHIQLYNYKNGLSSNLTWVLRDDGIGNLWVGTDSGVNIIDRTNGTNRYYTEKNGLCNNNVYSILRDHLGRMWVGTLNGLELIDLRNNTRTLFTNKEGLAANDIYSLFEKDGHIYVGTGLGLTTITESDELLSTESLNRSRQWKLRSFGKYQGLASLNFDEDAGYITPDNEAWWGVDQVLIKMNLDKKDTAIHPTFITGVEFSGKRENFIEAHPNGFVQPNDTIWSAAKDTSYVGAIPLNPWLKKNNITWDSVAGPFNMPNNLQLPYNQNYLSFRYTSLNLANRDKTRYCYILEGIDQEWSNLTDHTYTDNYRDLSPGKYTFRVVSVSLNGLWSNPATLSFTILPPWWKTWWAWFIYLALFGSAIWAFIQNRSKQLVKENQLLEQKVSQRTRELKLSLDNLKQAQSQLIQSEKMASLGELTAGIAHEIQNPLNFVNNFSEVSIEIAQELKQELEKMAIPETEKKYVADTIDDLVQNQQKINYHGKRADAIVKGMLQHSRASTGQKELTDINALADEYLRLSFHGLRAKDKSFNATIQTDFDPNAGELMIVPQNIGRVLLNLFNNAFYEVAEKKSASDKTSAENANNGPEPYEPTVFVSTKKLPGMIEIRIRDNGRGIPKKLLDKIFQPFFTTKPTGQGTGLGLSLSYDIVTKEHGGSLTVDTHPGLSSEFIILLPA